VPMVFHGERMPGKEDGPLPFFAAAIIAAA
jgi:hypothetical protein